MHYAEQQEAVHALQLLLALRAAREPALPAHVLKRGVAQARVLEFPALQPVHEQEVEFLHAKGCQSHPVRLEFVFETSS